MVFFVKHSAPDLEWGEKMRRNTYTQLWRPILGLAVVLVLSLVFYMQNLNNGFSKEVLSSLEEVSNQGAISLQTEVYGKMNLLEDLAAVLDIDFDAGEADIAAEVQEVLLPVAENNGFVSMGIVLPDGTTYITSGQVYHSERQQFYADSMEGETTITGRVATNESADTYVNLYSTPIMGQDGNIQAILIAAYRTEDFRSTIEVKSFNGEGYSYMVTNTGDVVVDSEQKTSFQNMTNVYLSMENADPSNTRSVEQLHHYMEHHESGSLIFRNKVDKYMYCMPVGINDWYLLTVVPVSIMEHQLKRIIWNTIILIVILLAVFLLLIRFIVQQQKKRQEELMTLAYVDPITGGHTFAKFQQVFSEIVPNNPSVNFALLSLDLSRFKMINDLYGYDEGDRIIQNMERIWHKLFRPHECCSHRMADRFVVLLTYQDREELEQRMQKYRRELQETANNRYNLNLRVGVYELEDSQESFSTAFNRAMMAFAGAKNAGTQFYVFYDSSMEERLVWEKYVEDYFPSAMKNHEFVVYYQAKIDVETGIISGAEALVRWVRPDGTIIPPSRFIPVLENNGMIAELDRYMFREVCLRQNTWLQEGKKIVPVSVNLSRVQLAEQNFVSAYENILKETGLPAEYIGLEFTESAMFDNEDVLREAVDRLHDLGIKVLIDDFGTGYSSMLTLKVIPVDILKMDKSFIDSIGDERGNKMVVGVIDLALSLGMSVTAEGVENDEQYHFLRQHRCSDIQGYYFSKPIPASDYCKKFLISA